MGVIAKFAYDPMGRRIWREAGSEITWFLYSDKGLLGEYQTNGTAIREYGWNPGGLWGTDPVWQKDQNGTFLAHNDHLYTTDVLSKASDGTIAWSAEREAFGKTTVSSGAATEYLLRFPGQWEDRAAGFYQNWHREYETAISRFNSIDPLGILEINLHVYTQANPINRSDPEGLLTRLKNCNLNQRIEISRAEDIIRKKLKECRKNCEDKEQSCVPCDKVKNLRNKLEVYPVVCTSGDNCGRHNGIPIFGKVLFPKIELNPGAFNPSECGCLEATIFHELLHGVFGFHTVDGFPFIPSDKIWYYERQCFPCSAISF
jgi:RHS repeat-associated protein